MTCPDSPDGPAGPTTTTSRASNASTGPRVKQTIAGSPTLSALRVSPDCRGPPGPTDLEDEKDRAATRSSKTHRRLPAPHQKIYAQCSRVTDGIVTGTWTPRPRL